MKFEVHGWVEDPWDATFGRVEVRTVEAEHVQAARRQFREDVPDAAIQFVRQVEAADPELYESGQLAIAGRTAYGMV